MEMEVQRGKVPGPPHHWGVVELEYQLRQSDSRAHILNPGCSVASRD